MKHALLLVLVVIFCAGMVIAQPNTDLVVIPKTEVAPEIDGLLDTTSWAYVAETVVNIADPADGIEPDDWFDNFASVRMMWDDMNLYIWMECNDDIIVPGTDWNYDGVELYFDADNSKTEEAYDGVDDIQMRFNVGEETVDDIDTGYGGAADWGFDKTTVEYYIGEEGYGWVLEAAIPLDQLQLVPGLDFGFDVQTNDNDEESRETMLRWWGSDNNAWHYAHLFGDAVLSEDLVVKDGYLAVPEGTTPTIDGEMGADEWADAWSLPVARFEPGHYDALYDHVEGVEDFRAWSWVKWGNGALHYYLKVWDDYLDYAEDEESNWEFDSIELFFDGDNSKGETYDGADDVQTRLNLGQEGAESVDAGYGTGAAWDWDKSGVEYVVMETDMGWDVEASYPLGELFIAAEVGAEFGFEMQLNDCDDPDVTPNRTVARWWAPGEPTWSNASLFGTFVLAPAIGAVEENVTTVANEFALAQNYPNPFNPSTTIAYSLNKTDRVELTVYNMLGEQVATLENGVKAAGTYNVTFEAAGLPSGIYIYTLKTSEQVVSNKMMLVK